MRNAGYCLLLRKHDCQIIGSIGTAKTYPVACLYISQSFQKIFIPFALANYQYNTYDTVYLHVCLYH